MAILVLAIMQLERKALPPPVATLGALNDHFDVAVVASGDTDLVPAIEAAAGFSKVIENAVWAPANQDPRAIRRGSGKPMWFHALDESHFGAVSDDTDYAARP